MSKNGEEIASSKTNESPKNVSMVPLIAVLTTLPTKSEENLNSFSSMSKNDNDIFLLEKVQIRRFQWRTVSESFEQKNQ